MNGAHFHLVINHFPIILLIVGIMLLAISLIIKSVDVKRTGYFFLIMGAVSSAFAMASGENAEEIVENLSGISESLIEEHEESAETFALLNYILGGISLIGLWASLTKKSFERIIAWVVIVFSGILLFFARQTGTSGGEIRHPEIINGAVDNFSTGAESEEEEDD